MVYIPSEILKNQDRFCQLSCYVVRQSANLSQKIDSSIRV